MMPDIFSADIRSLFFLALRVLAAAGGFLAGWYLTGPVVWLLARLAFHRNVPRWANYLCKLVGGVVVAVIVFWFLPLGSGGGGGGSGGGTGKGVGPGTDGTGGKTVQSGKGEAKGEGGPKALANKGTEIVVVQLLGGKKVKDRKYYLVGNQSEPLDDAALHKYLKDNLQKIAVVEMVLTDDSVGEAHPAYRYVQQLVLNDLGLQLKVVIRESK